MSAITDALGALLRLGGAKTPQEPEAYTFLPLAFRAVPLKLAPGVPPAFEANGLCEPQREVRTLIEPRGYRLRFRAGDKGADFHLAGLEPCLLKDPASFNAKPQGLDLSFTPVLGMKKMTWGGNGGPDSRLHLAIGAPPVFKGETPAGWAADGGQMPLVFVFQGNRGDENPVKIVAIPPKILWTNTFSVVSGEVTLQLRVAGADKSDIEFSVVSADTVKVQWDEISRKVPAEKPGDGAKKKKEK